MDISHTHTHTPETIIVKFEWNWNVFQWKSFSNVLSRMCGRIAYYKYLLTVKLQLNIANGFKNFFLIFNFSF